MTGEGEGSTPSEAVFVPPKPVESAPTAVPPVQGEPVVPPADTSSTSQPPADGNKSETGDIPEDASSEPKADIPRTSEPQSISTDSQGTTTTSASAPPTSEQRANVAPQEETEITPDLFKDINQMINIVVEKYNIRNIDDPDQLKEELKTRNDLSPALRKALQIRADISRTQKAIATAVEKNHQVPDNPSETNTQPNTNQETDAQIESHYQKDKGLFRVDNDGNRVTTEVIYLNQTFNVFVRELGKIGESNREAKALGEKLASQLTRSINRPDIYVFDTSENRELKRNNDLNYSVSDAIVLSLEGQLNGETDINKIAQGIKDGTITADPSVGVLANLLVWYNQTEVDSPKRKLLSGLMDDELRHLDAKKLNELGKKSPQHKVAVDKILQYRSVSSEGSELAKTQKMFEEYLTDFDDAIELQVRSVYGKELAETLKLNFRNNIRHTIPMFLYAHAIENSEFMTRDEAGHIVLKHEYDTQLTEIIQTLGFNPAEKQMIINLALSPGTPLAILNASLGIDGRMLNSEKGMEEQAHEASKIIVGRAITDPEPLIAGIEANQDIETTLKSGMGKVIEEMTRLNMGPGMHIDEEKLKKLLGKSFSTGAMAILMLWSQIMDVVSTDENKLAG